MRRDSNPPSLLDVAVHTTQGQPLAYRLLSLPLDLLWSLDAALGSLIGSASR